MSTVAMSLEGVLTDQPDVDLGLSEVTDLGRSTFNLLKHSARIVFLCTDPIEDRVKQWLIRERITGYSLVYNRPVDSPYDHRRWRINKMVDLMGIGHRFDFYVDTDPLTIAAAMGVGINGLLMGVPHTYPGQDKGPANPTPWYDLVRQVDEQNALRAQRAQQESEANDPDPT